MAIPRNARTVGLSTQVNTTVTTHNVDLLPEMVRFAKELGAVQWSVFFLVPIGRGQELSMITPRAARARLRVAAGPRPRRRLRR